MSVYFSLLKYLDYQIPVTHLKGLKGDDQEYIYFMGSVASFCLLLFPTKPPSTCYILSDEFILPVTHFPTNLVPVTYFPTNLVYVTYFPTNLVYNKGERYSRVPSK